MKDNDILRIIYTSFLGLLLAIFIGIGINTFYIEPVMPKYPTELNTYKLGMTDEQISIQREYDKKMDYYQNVEMTAYNRNVSIIVTAFSIIFLAASLFFENKKIKVLTDGVLLGSLLTLVYGLLRGFGSQDNYYAFSLVSVGLVIVAYLGYHRFIRRTKK